MSGLQSVRVYEKKLSRYHSRCFQYRKMLSFSSLTFPNVRLLRLPIPEHRARSNHAKVSKLYRHPECAGRLVSLGNERFSKKSARSCLDKWISQLAVDNSEITASLEHTSAANQRIMLCHGETELSLAAGEPKGHVVWWSFLNIQPNSVWFSSAERITMRCLRWRLLHRRHNPSSELKQSLTERRQCRPPFCKLCNDTDTE